MQQLIVPEITRDPDNGVYLGIKYSDPKNALSGEGESTIQIPRGEYGRTPHSEILDNLALGYATIAHPTLRAWHDHDRIHHYDGLVATGRDKTCARHVLNISRVLVQHTETSDPIDNGRLLRYRPRWLINGI